MKKFTFLFLFVGLFKIIVLQAQTVKDQDGNEYKTVIIGTQVWMAENLRTTLYNDGTPIPHVTDSTVWSNLTTAAYCWYENNIAYKNPYGALYNWYTVNTGKLCPTGWRVPSDADWSMLSSFLGGKNASGGKLKASGTAYWYSPNTGATNVSNFSALPAGNRFDDGSFLKLGTYSAWWSATQVSTGYAWSRYVYYYDGDFGRDSNYDKRNGFSVRCLKN